MAISDSRDRFNGVVSSLAFKAPVKVATNANLTLENAQTVNGVVLVTGDRVLVKDQTDPVENGIYVVRTGAWERAADFDGSRDVTRRTLVAAGRSGGSDLIYEVITDPPMKIGEDPINWQPFLDPDAVGGSQNLASVTGVGNTTTDDIILNGGVFYLSELAAAKASSPGQGQLWIRNDTPNVLVFTDDAGNDTVLQAALTEVNDLTAAVVWDTVPNAYISAVSVVQHQSSIDHDQLLNFDATEHFADAAADSKDYVRRNNAWVEASYTSFGEYRGTFDATVGTFPATNYQGDWFNCTVAGTVDSQPFIVGDILMATVDIPSTTTFAGNWTIVPNVGIYDHTLLTNIGTNTHAQIDTHIADATVHFTKSSTFDSIQFNTAFTKPAHTEGLFFYDQTEKTMAIYNDEADVTHQLGQEGFIRVYNNTGVTILNGEICYIVEAEGVEGRPSVGKARADVQATSEVIGLATHDIENATFGYVTYWGVVNEVDTSAFNEGDILYLSSQTAGAITKQVPPEGSYLVSIGYVGVAHATLGTIVVDISSDLSAPFGEARRVIIPCEKGSVGTINPGQVVYITGWDISGEHPEVELADSSTSATMPAIGVARETITNTVAGEVVVLGTINDHIDTSTFTIGDPLYVSETAGAVTNVKPTGAALIQKIGIVARSHASNGVVEVFGAGRSNDLPNIANNNVWVGNVSGVPTETAFDHTNLASIGTNTHAQIDTHIADTVAHLPAGTITDAALRWNGTAWVESPEVLLTPDASGAVLFDNRIQVDRQIAGGSYVQVGPRDATLRGDAQDGSLYLTGEQTGVVYGFNIVAANTNSLLTIQGSTFGGATAGTGVDINLPLTANSLSLTTALDETDGGTGFDTYATGDILYASAANTLSKLAAGTDTHVLTLTAGVPTWAAPAGGGGTIGGSITDNQIAVGAATANDIEGSASLTWDGTTLLTTGEIRTTGNITEIEGASPRVNLFETGAAVDEGKWRVMANGNNFYLDTLNDAESVAASLIEVTRTGTVGDEFRLKQGLDLRVYDTTDADYIQLTHTGANGTITTSGVGGGALQLSAANALIQFTGSPNVRVEGAGNILQVRDGGAFRVVDSGNTDYAEFSHDGTNFNTDFTNTDNWLIGAGLTNAVLVDSAFQVRDAATAKFRIAHAGSDVVEVRDGYSFRVYEADDSTYFQVSHDTNSTNIEIAGTGVSHTLFLGMNYNQVDVTTGTNFRIRDGADLVIFDATDVDKATFSHDGTSFSTAFVGTTNWAITGLTGRITNSGETLAYLSEVTAARLSHQATLTTTGWYRIGSNTSAGGRGAATFYLSNTGGSTAPAPMMFRVSKSYAGATNADMCITILSSEQHYATGLQQLRLVFDTTGTDVYVEAYIVPGASSTWNVKISPDDTSTDVWAAVDFTTGNAEEHSITWDLNTDNAMTGWITDAEYAYFTKAGGLQLSSNLITTGLIESTNIGGSSATGNFNVWGGAGAGANVELYAASHATLANRAYYDAVIHSFRDVDATPTYMVVDTDGVSVTGAVDATGNVSVGGYLQNDGAGYVDLRTDTATAGGMRVYNSANTLQGYLYHDNAQSFGLLHSSGGWAVKVQPAGTSVDISPNLNALNGIDITNGATFGSVLGASTTDLSDHIALYSTNYGMNVTSSNINFVAAGVNTFSTTGTEVVTKVPVKLTAGMYEQDNGAGGRVFMPEGGFHFTASNVFTGAIQIDLPAAAYGDNDMLSFEVSVYDYASNESFKLLISGYMQASQLWNNESVQIIASSTTRNFAVRFGASSGTRQTVWIGELTDTWNYPQISITNFMSGYTTADVSIYADDWVIGFQATSFNSVDATLSNNFPIAGSVLTSTGNIVANTGTYAGVNTTTLRGGYAGYSVNGGDIVLMSNGSTHGIYDDVNNKWWAVFAENSAAELYYNGSKTFQTQTDGINIADASGGSTYIGFYDAGFATRQGYVQFAGSSATIRSEAHGVPLNIQGEDAAGTVRNILIADPDAVTTLYGDTNVEIKCNVNDLGFYAIGGGASAMYYNGNPELQTQDGDGTSNSSGAAVKCHEGTYRDIGFNVLPTFGVNTSDTLEASHCGKMTGKTNTTAYTLTGPDSTQTANVDDFPVGGVCTVMNLGTSVDYTITDTATCTMYYCDGSAAPVDIVGTGTLAPGGVVTLYRYSATAIYIFGSGFTP